MEKISDSSDYYTTDIQEHLGRYFKNISAYSGNSVDLEVAEQLRVANDQDERRSVLDAAYIQEQARKMGQNIILMDFIHLKELQPELFSKISDDLLNLTKEDIENLNHQEKHALIEEINKILPQQPTKSPEDSIH